MRKSFILFITFLVIFFSSIVSAEQFTDITLTGTAGIWSDTRSYASIDLALTAIGAAEQTLIIAEEVTCTTLTIPSNIRLKFIKAGAINNSDTLTIQTRAISVDDGHQIFVGTGGIDFADGTVVEVPWFASAYQAFLQTQNDRVRIRIRGPTYLTTNVSVGNDVAIESSSRGDRIIVASGVTLSNIKNIYAANYTLLTGPGDYDFVAGTDVRTSWFTGLRAAVTYTSDDGVDLTIHVTEPTTVDYNITLAAHQILDVDAGALITINPAITLTVNSQCKAGFYQIFGGTGTAVVSTYPQDRIWWGETQHITHISLTATDIYTDNIYTADNIYYPDYSEVDQGLAGAGKSVKTYVDSIGSDNAIILFRHNSGAATTTYTFSTDETIPANIHVICQRGAILSVATGKTLTISDPSPSFGHNQVFTGLGSFIVATKHYNILWRGVVAGGAAATNAITLASAFSEAIASGCTIYIPRGTYAYNGAGLTYTAYEGIVGDGWLSILDYQGTGVAITIADNVGYGVWGPMFRYFRLTTSAGTPTGGLYLGGGTQYGYGNCDKIRVDSFDQVNAYGIRVQKMVSLKLDSCTFDLNYNNIYTSTDANCFPTTVTVSNCRIRSATNDGAVITAGVGWLFTQRTVIESNAGSGLNLTRGVTSGLVDIAIIYCHFENNMTDGGANDYDIIIKGTAANPATNILIAYNKFVGITGGGNIDYGYLWRFRVHHNNFSSGITRSNIVYDPEWVGNNSGDDSAVEYHDSDHEDRDVYSAVGINLREKGSKGTTAGYSTHQLLGSLSANAVPGDGATNTAIATLTETVTPGEPAGGIVLVSGYNNAKTKRFVDIVVLAYGYATALHSTNAAGIPAARTYSVAANITLNLQFANDGDSYNIRISQLTN